MLVSVSFPNRIRHKSKRLLHRIRVYIDVRSYLYPWNARLTWCQPFLKHSVLFGLSSYIATCVVFSSYFKETGQT